MSVKVNALDHFVINVADVARSTEWYRKILGMEVRVFDPGAGKTPRTSLVFGNQKINVRPRNADKVEWFTADHETAGSDDLCFLTASTPDQVVAHLRANGVAIEEGPVAKQGARGTLRSVYCRDPDGSLIEISSYGGKRSSLPVIASNAIQWQNYSQAKPRLKSRAGETMSILQAAPGVVGPFTGLDVPWLLRMRSQSRCNHPFLIWAPFDAPARSWSYGEFHERVGALAAGLARRGVRPGEYVLIHLDNCIEAVLAWFACVELGAIAVTTNTRSAAAEMEYFAGHCGAVAAITQPAYAELISANCRDLRWIAVISHDAGTAPAQGKGAARGDSFKSLFADSAERPRRTSDPFAPCSVQYTSGTTSRPKAVLWTHANALWGAKINAAHEDLHQGDVHQTYLPLFHTNALAYSMLATLWVGASCVIQPRFSASRFWNVALEHNCTWTSTIPFCMKALLEHEIPKNHKFRLWGTAVNEPPPFAAFGIKMIGWWGMTETITHGIVGEVDQPNTPMSIGRAAPEYAIRITDDDGRPTGVGGTGNLLIKGIPGLSLFSEYLHNEKATRESFDEHGYFITGDRVTLLDHGFIRFGDRAKDMLKVGGENVAASEIEQVIAVVPGVREAAVVAKKHPMLDEVPVVFIIPQSGVADAPADLHDTVMAACRKALADFKVPREIRLVDEMPRSTLEKVAKAELRKLLD